MNRISRFLQVLGVALAAPISPDWALARARGDDKDVAAQAKAALAKNCYRCHGETQQGNKKLDVAGSKVLTTPGKRRTYVVPRSLDKSSVREKIDEGTMAQDGTMDEADKAAVRRWIEAGAPELVIDWSLPSGEVDPTALRSLVRISSRLACPAVVPISIAKQLNAGCHTAPESDSFLWGAAGRGGQSVDVPPSLDLAGTLADSHCRCGTSGYLDATLAPTAYGLNGGTGAFANSNFVSLASEIMRTLAIIIRDRLAQPSSAHRAASEWLAKLASPGNFRHDSWENRYLPLRGFTCSMISHANESVTLSLGFQFRIMDNVDPRLVNCRTLTVSRSGFALVVRPTI
jgi:hypothetical protein